MRFWAMRRSDSAVGELTGVEHYIGMIRWWLTLALELSRSKSSPAVEKEPTTLGQFHHDMRDVTRE